MSKSKKEKAKKYYRNMIAEHQRSLAKLRKSVDFVLDEVLESMSFQQGMPLADKKLRKSNWEKFAQNLTENITEDYEVDEVKNESKSSHFSPKSTQNQPTNSSQPIDNQQNEGQNKISSDSTQNEGKNSPQDTDDNTAKYPYDTAGVYSASKSYGLKFFSEHESLSDVISKLGRVLLRIIPLEQQIAKLHLTTAELDELHDVVEKCNAWDPEEEMKNIDAYIELYNRDKAAKKAAQHEIDLNNSMVI